MNFYIGCPIWANKGWVGSLFPEGTKPSDFLKLYAQQLTTVEGNTTFYAVPSRELVQRWVDETPDTFRFCPKVPKAISHAGKLMEHVEEAQQFIETMSLLGERLGPQFLQLPPSYPPSMIDDLTAFLENWPADMQLAVEVRHLSWFNPGPQETLQTLLARHHMGRVMIDTRPIRTLGGTPIMQGSVYERLLAARERKPNVPLVTEPTAGFTFLRYIGHPLAETNAPFLDEWADQLAGWLREGLDAYVFCHCPDELMDPQICRDLHRHVSSRVSVPPLPQRNQESTPKQRTLF